MAVLFHIWLVVAVHVSIAFSFLVETAQSCTWELWFSPYRLLLFTSGRRVMALDDVNEEVVKIADAYDTM